MSWKPGRSAAGAASALLWIILACLGCGEETWEGISRQWGGLITDEVVVEIGPDGKTGQVGLVLNPAASSVGIRVTTADPEDERIYCFQLEAVVDSLGVQLVAPADNQSEWGPTCRDCTQRVSVGHGFGWFIFPNDGSEWKPGNSLHTVISVRDCATLLPADPRMGDPLPVAVRIQALGFRPTTESDLVLSLFVAYPVDWVVEETEAASRITDLVEDTNTRYFSDSLPSLELAGTAGLDLLSSRLIFSDRDQTGLDLLYRQARMAARDRMIDPEQVVMVILVPCLEQESVDGSVSELQGFTPRIPGGGGPGAFADGVFLSTNSCRSGRSLPPPTSQPGSRLLAHELGHFLGLYHTREPSGAIDHLADTDDNNLMYYLPDLATSLSWTRRQQTVMRAHPLVRQQHPPRP